MKKRFLCSVLLLLSPLAILAQTTTRNVDYLANPIITPQFFIAVIAGVILALGFQFILTALSIALGITAIGDLKESYVKNKYHTKEKDTFNDSDNDEHEDKDDGMSTGTMITTGFGLWSVITVSLSLFGATALAINLSLISSTVISITLGLVIWASFFILLFYLESRIVNTLLGGLINTATAGLRASGEAVKEMFSTSKEQQLKNVAEDTVDKIRKDLSSSFDPKVINDTVDEFFKRVDKSVPDYERVKKDIQQIIEQSNEQQGKLEKENIKEQSKTQSSGGGQTKWLAISQVLSSAIQNAEHGSNGQDEGKVEQLKELQKELKAAYNEGGSNQEKMEKVLAQLTPAEEEQIHKYVEKIKQLMATATPDDFEKGQLQEKFMQVVKDPGGEANKLARHIGDIDRETVVTVLAENTALDRDQVEKYADKVLEIIEGIKEKFSSNGAAHPSTTSTGELSDLKNKAERVISQFINPNGNSGSGLDFSMLSSLFMDKLDDGKQSLNVVKRRIQNLDSDSIKAILFKNTNIDQRDLDKVVHSIEEAKEKVMHKVTQIEDEANRRVENLKRKAVIQAEHARQNAAAAAWWLVASAVVSGGMAIAGSLVAMS